MIPLGVGPQVAGAGERHVADQLDGRAQRADRPLGRLQPGTLGAAADEVGVGRHPFVQRQDVGRRPSHSSPASGSAGGPSPRRLRHDVGERCVADVEKPWQLQAPARVERSRCNISQAIGVFDRSKLAA